MSFWKALGTALAADFIVSASANKVATTVVETTGVSESLAERRHAELLRALERDEPPALPPQPSSRRNEEEEWEQADDPRLTTKLVLMPLPGLSQTEVNFVRSIMLGEVEDMARLNESRGEVEDYG